MKKLTKEQRKIFREIASFYGCRVRFRTFEGGTWHGDFIEVGDMYDTQRWVVSLFCHELAHFINWKTGKYPLYHNPKNFGKMKKLFPKYGRLVRYSLNAEIYTEKIGAELCKEWFPRVKYERYYKPSKLCFEFLSGYYLTC
jgi:hypothetical protein